jgi:hypothetical protein
MCIHRDHVSQLQSGRRDTERQGSIESVSAHLELFEM